MKHSIQIGKHTFKTDYGFLLILAALFLTSCFALYNSYNLVAPGYGPYYLNRQIMWYCICFAALFGITRLQNQSLYKILDSAYKFLMGVLIYMFISRLLYKVTGHTLPLSPQINGAFSWIVLPIIGSFQASEFMKIILIIKTSQIIAGFQQRHPNPTVAEDFQMLIQIARWALPPMILVLLQPDTGVFIIMTFTLLVLVLCSGIRKSYMYWLLGIVGGIVLLLFYFYFFHRDILGAVVSQYQLNRIDAWLNPDDYILGSSNQLYTSLLSLGSAGLTGHGMQASIISIPEAHTDFIFAAFGQCFGFMGCIFIVLLCLTLDLYLCKMAFNAQNREDRFMIIGAIAMLFYQQFQNLGMIVGLVPITGITLPLISYGGSSMLSYFILFGFILNVSPSAKKIYKVKKLDIKNMKNHMKIKYDQYKSKKTQESQ